MVNEEDLNMKTQKQEFELGEIYTPKEIRERISDDFRIFSKEGADKYKSLDFESWSRTPEVKLTGIERIAMIHDRLQYQCDVEIYFNPRTKSSFGKYKGTERLIPYLTPGKKEGFIYIGWRQGV